MNNIIKFDNIINTCGLICPEPLMLVRINIRKINIDQTLMVIADDVTTIQDIPRFCFFMKYTLLSQFIEYPPYYYLIYKYHFR